jgi:hypothetical protein
LVDLDVIRRYSLALRREAAPAAEVLASLDASRAAVLALMRAEMGSIDLRSPRGAKAKVTGRARPLPRTGAPPRTRSPS